MLLLDVGNSAIKAQIWRQGNLQSSCRIRTGTSWCSCFEDFLSSNDLEVCYYAGVPGTAFKQEIWDRLEKKYGRQGLHQLIPLHSSGRVVNGYADPSGIGVDRWLAILGAAGLTDKDAMIVDAGSAITVDLLKAGGQHLGGAILPGFNTTLERFREILSKADFDHPDIDQLDSPGLTTEHCIHINHDLEDTSYLDSLIECWFSYLGDDAVLFLCGGDAHRVNRSSQREVLMVPDLVFAGMRQQLEHCG
ncbi:MAG: type III pantothenate kinase [Gammaproteobacteria bacterium]|nr:type III pantothenate kinase [Gammaproteobacteria bacterium]